MRRLVRPPAVAGQFYPASARALEGQVHELMPEVAAPVAAKLLIGPHAGYVYSGAILGETYAEVRVPARVILLGPNHTGRGARMSLYGGTHWRLPGGELPLDRGLLEALHAAGAGEFDVDAHAGEHSLEVHVPFLLARQPALQLAPLCLSRLSITQCEALGAALATVVREHSEPVLLAVSSDMHHFASAAHGRSLDQMALERLLALDPAGLYEVVRDNDISMCGVIPATAALFAARQLGATSARLIRYGHSGEVSGDHQRVVGYAGLVFT